jgi:hypothetical protein
MTKRQDRDALYVKPQFDTEIIVVCVRWYITYRLSYRDLVAMMAGRRVIVSHTTIMRWVIRYVAEFENAGIDLPARSAVPGALTRLTSRSRANGAICTEPWTSKAQRRLHAATGSGHCALRRRSFGGRLPRIRIELRARSHSMAMYRATECCGSCDASTLLGAESEFGVQNT